MIPNATTSIILGCLALAACNRSTDQSADVPTTEHRTESQATAPSASPSSPSPTFNPGDGMDRGDPDLTRTMLTPEIERTEEGARSLLLSWSRAMELKRFDQAWKLLDESSQQRWPKGDWAGIFSDLREITVSVPAGSMEGAAGSSYYTAPVTITARNAEGRPVRHDGVAVLRRVNDIEGASPEQLRWHFDSLTLDWTH